MINIRNGNREKLLRDLCRSGVEQNVFPGCMAAISIGTGHRRQRFVAGAGQLAFQANTQPVNRGTFFDLASLTKPLCTSLCVLQLIKQGKLAWDTLLVDCVKALKRDSDKANISIEHLLTHSSGLKAYRPYFRLFKSVFAKEDKAKLLYYIHHEKIVYQPGSKNIYSDLGYILLGEIIEQQTNKRLDQFFTEQITRKLNLEKHLFFIPLDQAGIRQPLQDCAATEKCPWRGRVMQGEVHDEHCWLLGGVAGHAGLFGNIDGVLGLCELVFDQWLGKGDGSCLLSNQFEQLFIRTNNKLSWYRGFDRPTPGGSSSGRYFSEKSAGHLGFSGTSFWMDPEKEIVVVLLTNRVNPSRKNIKIRSFRPWFHDNIMEHFF